MIASYCNLEPRERLRVKAPRAGPPGIIDLPLGVQEQLGHRAGPAVPGLGGGDQLTQVMAVAEGVQRVLVVAIGRPAVVHGDAPEVGQHAGVLDRLAAAAAVGHVAGQLLGRLAVHPAEPLGDPGAGLVEVDHRGRDEQLAQPLVEARESCGRGLHPALKRSGRDPGGGEVGERLGRTVIRQVLVDAEVDAERPHPGPVGGRGADPVGEGGGRGPPAAAAPPSAPRARSLARACPRAGRRPGGTRRLQAARRRRASRRSHRSTRARCSTRSSGTATGSSRAPS